MTIGELLSYALAASPFVLVCWWAVWTARRVELRRIKRRARARRGYLYDQANASRPWWRQ